MADIYPESVHVREVDLREADDSEIWQYAKVEGYAIVSKDSDFQQRSLLYGAPPQFIWLRVGNCTVNRTEGLLRSYSAAIHTFDLDDSKITFDVALITAFEMPAFTVLEHRFQ